MVGDAAEGNFDWQLVERVRIVISEPLLCFDMARVFGVRDCVEGLVESGNSPAILGRRVVLTGDVAGVAAR